MPRRVEASVLRVLGIAALVTLVLPLAPRTTAYTTRAPITIIGDGAFTAANGVTGGSGTAADPYVIEGWDIDAASAVGIDIRNTSAHFVIRNLYVHSDGPNAYYPGIQLTSVTNATIANATAAISNWGGIYVFGAADLALLGNDLTSSGGASIVEVATNVTVSGNRLGRFDAVSVNGIVVTGNTMTALWAADSRNVTLAANTDSAAWRGEFRFERLDGLRITDLHAPSEIIWLLSGDNSTMAASELGDVYTESYHNLSIENNTVGNLTAQSSDGSEFSSNVILGEISAVDSNDVVVDNNTFAPSASGIRLSSSGNASVTRNFLSGGVAIQGTAPWEFDSHRITADNLIAGLPVFYQSRCQDVVYDGVSAAQILLASCRNVRVANLTIADAGPGVMLAFVENATVESSRITSSPGDGIVVWNSANVSVWGNNITDGGRGFVAHNSAWIRVFENDFVGARGYETLGFGVYLDSVAEARVDHNRFFSNEAQAGGSGTNVSWDDGYPSGGNWWSDYRMHDSCSGPDQDVCPDPDGFGDLPYVVFWFAWQPVDRYPQGPPNQPPVAQFTVTPVAPVPHETVLFNGQSSFDPDGEIVEARWDLGDGRVHTSRFASGLWHEYSAGGLYTVSLTVVDDSGASNTSSLQLLVSSPLDVPVAAFTVTPWMPVVGAPAILDASTSYDPRGRNLTYQWYFAGMNDPRQGETVTYTFTSPSTHGVYLRVTNEVGLFDEIRADVWVVDAPPTLGVYEHVDGRFRVPVPQGWDISENVSTPDGVVEVVVVRDTFWYPPNAVAVDTRIDSSAEENPGHLYAIANATIAALKGQRGNLWVVRSPTLREVSGHLAVHFEIWTYDGIEAYALVVSEEHGRFWALGLSAREAEYPGMRGLFDLMMDGFEILPPLPPPPNPPPGGPAEDSSWVFALGAAGAGGAAAAVFVGLMRRSQSVPRLTGGPRLCPHCGTGLSAAAPTCPACGSNPPAECGNDLKSRPR